MSADPLSAVGVNPPPITWRNRLLDWATRHKVLIECAKLLVTFLVGVGSSLLAINSFLQTKIDRAVTLRLNPYEKLAGGLSLNQAGNYDEAAELLRQALKEPSAAVVPAETHNLLYDQLLYALVNCDEPGRFAPELEQLKGRLGKQSSENGFRVHQIGWYYLRTGDPDQAKKYFRRALQLYDGRQERKQGAEPVRGLTWVALAEGKVQEAVETTKDFIERNPKEYTVAGWLREVEGWHRERYFGQYKGLYGKPFEKAVEEYTAELKKLPR